MTRYLFFLLLPLSCFSQTKQSKQFNYFAGVQLTSEKPMWIEFMGIAKKSTFMNLKVKLSTGKFNSYVTHTFSDGTNISYSGGDVFYILEGRHFSITPGYFISFDDNATGFWLIGLNLPMGIVKDKLEYHVQTDVLFPDTRLYYSSWRYNISAELELLRAIWLTKRLNLHFGCSAGYPLNYKEPFLDKVPEYENSEKFIPGIGYAPYCRLQMGLQYLINP